MGFEFWMASHALGVNSQCILGRLTRIAGHSARSPPPARPGRANRCASSRRTLQNSHAHGRCRIHMLTSGLMVSELLCIKKTPYGELQAKRCEC